MSGLEVLKSYMCHHRHLHDIRHLRKAVLRAKALLSERRSGPTFPTRGTQYWFLDFSQMVFFQVVWTDGSTSTLPRGVIAAHGEPVLIGDSVITFFSGDWYLATVNKLLPRGAVEVLWDDGTVSEVPLLHTFRVPE